MFVDVTWHLGSDPANLNKETSSCSIAAGCLDFCRVDTMLHMTCAQYTKEETLRHLEQCKEMGKRVCCSFAFDSKKLRLDICLFSHFSIPAVPFYEDYFTLYLVKLCVSSAPLSRG